MILGYLFPLFGLTCRVCILQTFPYRRNCPSIHRIPSRTLPSISVYLPSIFCMITSFVSTLYRCSKKMTWWWIGMQHAVSLQGADGLDGQGAAAGNHGQFLGGGSSAREPRSRRPGSGRRQWTGWRGPHGRQGAGGGSSDKELGGGGGQYTEIDGRIRPGILRGNFVYTENVGGYIPYVWVQGGKRGILIAYFQYGEL